MATKIINIHKQAGQKKDAVRVNTIADIPEFLKDTIKIEGESLILVCVEGKRSFLQEGYCYESTGSR